MVMIILKTMKYGKIYLNYGMRIKDAAMTPNELTMRILFPYESKKRPCMNDYNITNNSDIAAMNPMEVGRLSGATL